MEGKKEVQFAKWGIGVLVFLAMFVIYYQVHPLVPYDGDEWMDLSHMRIALPIWHEWNPIKILPEDGMGLMGYFGAYVMTPLLGDYVNGIRFSAALIMSIFIAAYNMLFYQFVKERTNENYPAIILTCLFFIGHFLIFKSLPANNVTLFSENQMETIFHYTLPAVVNCSLVLYFLIHHGVTNAFSSLSFTKKSLLVFWIYLAICSNVLQNEIMPIFIGALLLYRFIGTRNNINIKKFIRDNRLEIILILLWLFALFFEVNGGRSKSIGAGLFDLPFSSTLKMVKISFSNLNQGILAIGGVIIVYALAAFIAMKKIKTNSPVQQSVYEHEWNNLTSSLIIFILAAILTSIYIFLVCTKASPAYYSRPSVQFGPVFYVFLAITSLAVFGYKILNKPFMLSPIVLFCALCLTMSSPRFFGENILGYVPASTAMAISRDMIGQIQKADLEHKNKMVLLVPIGKGKDNWPHPNYMGSNISRTLFYHGIITKQIKITIKPDAGMNKKYGLPIPKKK